MAPKATDPVVPKAGSSASKEKEEKPLSKKELAAKKKAEEDELSDEDKQLKEELELCVTRLGESKKELWGNALTTMTTLIRASTTSMTSVPKPLKFMIPHFDTMKACHGKMEEGAVKKQCADVVSVLAMTMSEERECLKYKLLGNQTTEEIELWGHEYVRHLAGEVVQEFNGATEEDDLRKTLVTLAKLIVPSQMKHHAEAEACDLLMEVEQLDDLQQYVDDSAYSRVCLYLVSCVPYVPEPENTNLLKTALSIFRKFNQFPQAMRLALQLNDRALVEELFNSCPDPIVQKQLAYMLGRHQFYLELSEERDDYDDLTEIMSNSHLNNHFLNLARELDIMEAKTPDDVYKTHLDNVRPAFGGGAVDSARQNLASSFVNGFINTGFGQDKLLMEDGNKWLYKNKEHGMLSATASIGLVLLWDVDGGLTQIDKYLYSPEDWIKSGALLACGIVNTGVRNECDPALALLSDYVLHSSNVMRLGAIFGLGLAYAGTDRQDVIQLLLPVFADARSSMEVVGVAALACGLIAVGSCNGEVTSTILQTLMEKCETDVAGMKESYAKYLPLGIGLCYLGKQDAAEATMAALEVIPEPFRQTAVTLVEVCAYAGTGNVLKIQQLLHICSEHYEQDKGETEKKDKKKDDKKDGEKKDGDKKAEEEKKEEEGPLDLSGQQAVAVLGLGLISMGEDIGSEMLIRTLSHLMRYSEPTIRRAVPLALALVSISNPQMTILDTLSKFSHDTDAEVAHNAIFGLGLLGAGTNNARLAAILRQLAQYHAKDSNNLFRVRVAQGLVHLGKGTLTLNPFHSDRQLMSPVAVAGLMSVLVAMLDVKTTILGKSHYLLYGLATAMQPRMLVTFDTELRPLPVSVRVGNAVDVVGQAGKPKTITGFQTHTTPVLLAHGERAELATEEYIPVTSIMEGFVILKKNPDF
jgi:26S proteasome regulatory subunit N1